MDSFLKSLLWVLAELGLDLLGPMTDGILQDSSFILGRGLLGLCDISWWERKVCLAFDKSKGNLSVGKELMEFLHEIFADEIGPSNLVERISKNREEDFLN